MTRGVSVALLLLALAAAPVARAQSTTVYDYATRVQGTEIFAYDGESSTQVPNAVNTPAAQLNAGEYDDIEANDGTSHVYSVGAGGSYAQMRFQIQIDEFPSSVTRIDATWNGRGVNSSVFRDDGARLYIWSYASGAYELLQSGPDTENEVTLTGTRASSASDYIGGAGQNTITLLVVSADTRLSIFSTNQLHTDYVSVEVASTLCSDTYRDELNAVSYAGNDGTLSWSGPFVESDASGGGAAGGFVSVSGGRLVLRSPGNASSRPSIYREADTFGAASVQLSFTFATNSSVDSNDDVAVDVSRNGGASWTQLEALTGISGASTGSRSYDVTGFAAVDFRVRFRISAGYTQTGESMAFDDIQVQIARTCRAHFALVHDGAASTCAVEPIALERHSVTHQLDPTYSGTVTLSTSSGNGTWSLIAGGGTLVALGGGAATYTFGIADGGRVTLGLSSTVAETLDIDVVAGMEREETTEDPALTFTNLAGSTVRDEFSSVSYGMNDGTASWSGPWIERGDDGNPATGNVVILGGELVLEDFPNTNLDPSLERQVDLSAATTATFSFTFRTTAGVDANDSAFIEISTNGGASWILLENLTGITGATSGTRSYDISAYRSAQTRVRFRIDGQNGTGGTSCCYGDADEQLLVDNVEIQYTSVAVCGASRLAITHDGAGIHCLAEPVTVRALDGSGNPVSSYTRQITLDTQTGQGTWSLLSGGGTFADATPGDGRATYTYALADSGEASFLLSYSVGPPILDVDAFDTASPTVRDDDTEGTLTFSASGFTVTASPLSNPPPLSISDPIGTQTAGTTVALHLAAYGTTPTDPQCGVIESYTGAKTLQLWTTYVDPGAGMRVPSVGGSAIGASEAGAVPLGVAFTSGQAQLPAKYKDVGRIQIQMKDAAVSVPPGGIRGATNPFVWRPAELAITAVLRATDGQPNPGTSVPTGTVFVAAGAPFGIQAEVRDAEGDLTPSFGRESAPEGLRVTASTLVAPAGGRNGSADDGAIANATAFGTTDQSGSPTAPGAFYGQSFAWDEVGAIRLRASIADGTYLGTGDVVGTESGTVGRFTPADFVLALNTPRFAAGCTSGSFTYLGQPFGYEAGNAPEIRVTAVAQAGTTTRNYAGSWWRITAASLGPPTYTAAVGALDTTGLPPADPVITDGGNGTGTLAYSSGSGLRLVRSTLAAPFDADLELAADVIDLDAIAASANPTRFGQAVSGSGIAFSGGKSVRFGRIAVGNAHGSELASLAMPLYAEYWNGIAFTPHAADSGCTSIPVGALSLAATPPGLPTTVSIASDPLSAGEAGLGLSAPGQGNRGTVDVQANLGAGGAVVPWLRYDWPADGMDGIFDDDPVGRATFGIFAGDDPVIFRREVY
jgi:hypothetical protein